MRKQRHVVMARTCDFCGSETTQFAITANHLAFCNEGYIGKTTKDCHTKYIKQKEIEDVRKKRLQSQQEIQRKKEKEKRKEEKIKSFTSINQKLDEFYSRVGTPKTKRNYL